MLRGSNLTSVTVVKIFRVKILTVDLLTLVGLTLGQRSPKGEMTYCPLRSTILQNFRPIAQTVYEICITNFFTFWLRGANPWAKVHQTGGRPGSLLDLPSCKISLLYINPRPRYPLPKFLRTHKKTNSKRYVHNMPIGMCG